MSKITRRKILGGILINTFSSSNPGVFNTSSPEQAVADYEVHCENSTTKCEQREKSSS